MFAPFLKNNYKPNERVAGQQKKMKHFLGLKSVTCVLVAVVFVFAYSAESAAVDPGDINILMFKTLQGADSTIVGGATIAITSDTTLSSSSTSGGIHWENTMPFGKQKLDQTSAFSLTSCIHMNTMSELLVTAAAIQLQLDFSFATSLDENVSPLYLPYNYTLTNPKNLLNVTYKQLMQHTSSIVDATSYVSSYATTTLPVMSLSAFIEDYFLTSDKSAWNPSVFSTATPGLATSYAYARSNIALLSYILERVIVVKALPFSSLQEYLVVRFLQPFGMSSTFFINRTTGAAPGLQTMPSFIGTFTGVNTSSASMYAKMYTGCIADTMSASFVTAGVPGWLHPAGFADFMGYTTPMDVARLLRGLFFGTTFATLSSRMKDSFTISTTVARVAGQVGQGLGLMYFNGDVICSAATSTNVLNSNSAYNGAYAANCPLSNATTVFGFVANRDYVELGFLCALSFTTTSTTTSSTTTPPLCVVSTLLHNTASSGRSGANLYASAAVTMQELKGTTVIPEVAEAAAATAYLTTVPSEVDSEWYGAYVFLGVYGTLIMVYLVSMFVQWLVAPAALATAVDSAGAASMR